MSKEEIKLALEVLKAAYVPADLDEQRERVITVFEVELAKPDFWEGYVPEPVKPAQCKYPKCIYPCPDLPDCRDAEQSAQQALDKKAENARELGLDYEPAQQEPWPEEPAGHKAGGVQLSGTSKSKAITELYALFGAPHNADINLTGLNMLLDALIASPPPQRTWVGLVWGELPEDGHDHDFLRGAVWAEAKLKEKNT